MFSSERRAEFFLQKDGTPTMRVFWSDPLLKNDDLCGDDFWLRKSEVYANLQPEEFVIPKIYRGLGEIRERPLAVSWEKGPLALERYSQLVTPLRILGLVLDPGFEIYTGVWIYQVVPHGAKPKEQFRRLRGDDVYCGLKYAAYTSEAGFGLDMETAASCVWDVGLVWPGEKQQRLIIPCADLNVPYSGEVTPRLERVARILAESGYSGSIIASGKETHFLADFLVPKKLGPQIIGDLINLLSFPDNAVALEVARQLLGCQDWWQAKLIAGRLLKTFKSDQPQGSEIDLRWAAHIFVDKSGRAVLRVSDKPGRPRPYVIGEIR